MQNIFVCMGIAVWVLFNLGCNQDKQESLNNRNISKNDQRTTLHWLGHWYGEGRKELLVKELAREFSLLHQEVDVAVEFPQEMVGKKEGYYNLLVDSIAAMVRTNKWPFDIFVCGTNLYTFVGQKVNDPDWGKKYLVDFSNEPWYINAHKKSIFEKSNYNNLTNGIKYGVYLEGGFNLLFVSKTVEEKLGIKVKLLDMDVDDFIGYAKSAFEYNLSHSDKITFYSLITGKPSLDYLFYQFTMSALGKDKADSKEEALAALGKVYLALEKIAPYKPLEQNDTYKNELQLNADKALFIFNYSYISLLWEASNPAGEKLMSPCELPSLKGKKATFYPGQYHMNFAIPKNSKNVEEAKKLMQFMARTEVADKWVKYSKCPTGLVNGITYTDFGTDNYGKFAQHMKQKYNNRLGEETLSNLLFGVNLPIIFNVDKVMNGEMSGEEAYQDVVQQVKKI